MPSKGEFGEIDRRLSLRDILAGEHMLRKLDRTFRSLVYRNLVIAPGLLDIDCHNPIPGLVVHEAKILEDVSLLTWSYSYGVLSREKPKGSNTAAVGLGVEVATGPELMVS